MSRLIDADEYSKCLIDHMTVPWERAKYDISDDYNKGLYDAVRLLNTAPTIQPKRGKWIRDGHHIRCDQCGIYMCDTDREGDRIPTEFCSSCGSDMRGEQDG